MAPRLPRALVSTATSSSSSSSLSYFFIRPSIYTLTASCRHRHRHRHRLYSAPAAAAAAAADEGPLIRVANLPAGATGHIRVLELDRAPARNAISTNLLAVLRAQIDAIHAQYDPQDGRELAAAATATATATPNGPTRALIIASAVDTCFCAGADLKERRGFTPEETNQFLTNLRATFSSLASLPIPTITAISSVALGGGLELALATHFRVLTANATVGLPETRLGIIPGAGGTHRLVGVVGAARARDLILTGRLIDGSEAYFFGLADRLVEVTVRDDSASPSEAATKAAILPQARKAVLAEAVALATEICDGGPVAVRAAIQAVACPGPDKENEMYQRVVNTEDRNEALRAFQKKRKPVFTGK